MKKKLPAAVLEYFRKEGAKGGKIGGKARMDALTAEQRKDLAKAGAAARWGKKRKRTSARGE
jgi:hypothetical protein